MASVDNRVVSMQFDNADFEKKVSDTIKSLEELEKKLDFSSSKKSLGDLGDVSKGFTLGGIGDAVDEVSKKFIALGTIAITALANITNKAVDAGLRIAKSLTIENIGAGFSEYELKLGAIQTIMAGSGADLDTVNKKLQELNTYSDKTIYSFADMTQNIGKFTNAGISLDKSVASIQGVANVAAVSGANSEEASRAMYNFAQALSKGYVQLVDWKSIELANMGTVEFKQQLIDAAAAQGQLTKKGDKWITKAGSLVSATEGFNDSLTDQWLTTSVLTKTLGDYADETTAIGKKAFAAAQDVKTFSQLMSTVKESIGSGWAQSFEILIGNFDEAKALFTGINTVIGNFVGKNADARNALLQGWKDLGGRTVLIEALQSAFKGLASIVKPITDAFRDIFPPMTADRLFAITQAIKSLADRLAISGETADKIKRIFSGLFGALEIGWTIIKGVIGVVGNLISSLSGVGGGVLDVFAKIGDVLTGLNEKLVAGGGIKDFFESITRFIKDPIPYLKDLRAAVEHFFDTYDFGSFQGVIDIINNVKDAIVGFFTGSAIAGASEGVSNVIDRIKSRFELLGSILSGIWSALKWVVKAFQKILPVLEAVWGAITNWFKELGAKLGEVLKPGDFNKVVDAVNVGLFGAIAILLKKFIDNGLKLDFGGGFMDAIKTSLESLSGTLQAMQNNIKADTLLKIAEAIGILAVSLLLLSLIDSAALTKALTAMAISFGQLIGALALLNQIGGGVRGGLGLAALSTALVALSTAILILSVAVKILSTLSWEELAKGLLATALLLGMLVGVAKLLQGNTIGLISAGIALTLFAVGLNILAIAMKIFATMSWGEMLKGMVGVAGALIIIAGAMRLMPSNMLLTGAGLVAVGIGLNLIAASMKIFGTMSWEEMAKGLVAIAGGLLIIAGAMQLMPLTLPITAIGLILVGVALGIIAGAMKLFATMSWGEMAKGLVAMAGALTILAIATYAMSGTIAGAVAITIVAGALVILVGVLKQLAGMKIGDIVKGLVALAAIFAVIGLAAALLTPVIPAMLGLGAALFLLGAGLALFGIGAYLAAKAFETLAKAGSAGIDTLMHLIDAIIHKLPEMVAAVALAGIQIVTTLLEAAPIIIDMLGVLIVHILETLVKIAPALGETLIVLLDTVINVIRQEIPNLVQLGYDILIAFMNGIKNNIGEIVVIAVDIIVKFIDTITNNLDRIIESAVNLLTAFLKGISDRISEVISAGLDVLLAIIKGIGDNVQKIIDAATDVITKFITAVGNMAVQLATAGADVIIDLITGFGDKANDIITAGVDTIIKFIEGLGQNAVKLANAAGDVIVDFLNGIADAIRSHNDEIRKAGENIAGAIVDGMTGGLSSKAGDVAKSAIDVAKGAINAAKGFLGIGSPSRIFYEIGANTALGMAKGLDSDQSVESSAIDLVKRTSNQFQNALDRSAMIINKMPEFSPTITPVLDLSEVQRDAKSLSDMLNPTPLLLGNASYAQAQTISVAESRRLSDNAAPIDTTATPVQEIKFEQNNYSPEALSTNDIYRNTRNQIALAREELSI